MAQTASTIRRKKTKPVTVLKGDERFLSLDTYARTRGVSRRTISRWPGFPTIKTINRRVIVDPVEGDAWILAHASRKGPRALESRRVATR